MVFVSLGSRLRALPRLEGICWCLVLVCMLAALGVRPLVRAASPRLALLASYTYQEHELLVLRQLQSSEDPWGNPWRSLATPWNLDLETISEEEFHFWVDVKEDGSTSLQTNRIYSTGPNGSDEQGRGDDVFIEEEYQRVGFGLAGDNSLARLVTWTKAGSPVGIVAWSFELFLALGLALGWCATALWQLRQARSPRITDELARALFLASLPAALTSTAVFWLIVAQPWAQIPYMSDSQLLPPAGAGGSTTLVAWYLGCLWVRLRRGIPDPPVEDSATTPEKGSPVSTARGLTLLSLSLLFVVPGLGFLGLFLCAVLFFGQRLVSINEWGSLLLFSYGGIGSSLVAYECFRRGKRALGHGSPTLSERPQVGRP